MTLSLPELGLGTSGNDDPERCAETVARALEAGYRHVDTAQMYDNEAAVGAGIARADVPREEVVLATKIHPDDLAYEDAKRTARESLDRLGVDSVDMLYVHWPTSAYDPEATLRAMDELHDEGVCDHVCLSNFTPALLDEARGLLDAPVAAHQVECHPRLRQDDLREYAREHGHYLVGYSPLGKGELLEDPVLTDIAGKHDTTTAAVCLAWALAGDVLVPIPKGTGDHVEANLAARDLELDDADLERIEELEEKRFIDPDSAAWNR
ncbi:aldo/keto reductase [Halorarum halobium]|uniref:aldo/keto reductase n=1 Tax=Halorarum halobium TaxID=3075121 RepID=UPI0028AC0B5E|nr:aldo/keto reductase [Halobaculum sp. XH14]